MKIIQKIGNKMNSLVMKSYWYNEVLFPDCSKFWNLNTFNLDVVNLGSTTGVASFCYEDIPLKAANLALEHNFILVYQEILNNYCSYLNPHSSTVIIPLCPFTSLSGSYDYFEDRYYTILQLCSIPHGSVKRRLQILNLKERPLFNYPLFAMIKDLKMLFRSKKEIVRTEEFMENDAAEWINGWIHEFSLSELESPLSLLNQDGVDDASKILNEMISFCKERNIRPVILIPPVYHTLGEKFTSKTRNNIINPLLDKIVDKSVWYYNYMDDSDFANDITLFQNSFLLNKKGAKLFTKRVLKDLGLVE